MPMFTRAARRARRLSREPAQALRDEPYYLGDEAWHRGLQQAANPFAPGTEAHADWLAGWREAHVSTP